MALAYPQDNVEDGRPQRGFNKPLQLFYIAGLLVIIGGFNLFLNGQDIRIKAEADAGSPLSQAILGCVFLTSAILLAASPVSKGILRRSWPIMIFPALALLSALWSPDPALTLRRAVALVGTTLFGLSLASTYTPRDGVVLLIRALTAAMVLSLLFALLSPQNGIHQATDANQPEHAGLWRGIFAHRNVLGFSSGINTGLLVLFGRQAFANIYIWLFALAATLACQLGARSGTSFVITFSMLLFAATLLHIHRQPPQTRVRHIITIALLAVVVAIFYQPIFEFVLTALGKTKDLTGRTAIWNDVWQLLSGTSALLGFGYFSGYVMLEKQLESLNHGVYGSAHNAYLQALVYFGYPGLLIFIAIIGWFMLRGVRTVFSTKRSDATVVFPATIIFALAASSFAESYLTEANSLSSVLFTVAAGMLGRSPDPKPNARSMSALGRERQSH